MRKLLLLLLVLYPGFALYAQSTEDEIKARLLHKPLYLRGLWLDDKLSFDATGMPVGKVTPFSFTLAGVDINKVKLFPDHLQLEGRRVGLEFPKSGPKRVPLEIAKGDGPSGDPVNVTIQIASPPTADYGTALDAIFAPDLAALVPTLPSYWKSYATEHLLPNPVPPTAPPAKTSSAPGTSRVGGGVTAPVAINRSEPTFNGYARAHQLSGTVLIYFQVDKQGKPNSLRILRPLGLGLDERALYAVQQYTFHPAMRGAEPVAVELNVEVKFEIY